MYQKFERLSILYWMSHWLAFQSCALATHHYKFHYLFHDWLKLWQKLIWRDYKKVQKYHRTHNSHHLEYSDTHGVDKLDFEAMAIDWECSACTKSSSCLNAYQSCLYMIKDPKLPQRYKDILLGELGIVEKPETWFIMSVLKKLDLYRPGPWDNYTFEELKLLKKGKLYSKDN